MRLTVDEESLIRAAADYFNSTSSARYSRSTVIRRALRNMTPPADSLGPKAAEYRRAYKKAFGQE